MRREPLAVLASGALVALIIAPNPGTRHGDAASHDPGTEMERADWHDPSERRAREALDRLRDGDWSLAETIARDEPDARSFSHTNLFAAMAEQLARRGEDEMARRLVDRVLATVENREHGENDGSWAISCGLTLLKLGDRSGARAAAGIAGEIQEEEARKETGLHTEILAVEIFALEFALGADKVAAVDLERRAFSTMPVDQVFFRFFAARRLAQAGFVEPARRLIDRGKTRLAALGDAIEANAAATLRAMAARAEAEIEAAAASD